VKYQQRICLVVHEVDSTQLCFNAVIDMDRLIKNKWLKLKLHYINRNS